MRQLQAVGRETKPNGRIDQTEARTFGQPGVSKRQGRMAYMWLPTVCVRSIHSRMVGVGKGWTGEGGGGVGGVCVHIHRCPAFLAIIVPDSCQLCDFIF